VDRLSRERIATIVGAHRAKDPLLAVPGRRAAVAAIIRFDRVQPEILLMQRAERDGDRWSGHVSMPGGNFDPRDEDLRATAIRETREEVGLDLAECAQGLGRLDAIQAVARGKILPMTITPFVFALVEDRPLALGPEAAAAFWLPLEDAARGARAAHHRMSVSGTAIAPAISADERNARRSAIGSRRAPPGSPGLAAADVATSGASVSPFCALS